MIFKIYDVFSLLFDLFVVSWAWACMFYRDEYAPGCTIVVENNLAPHASPEQHDVGIPSSHSCSRLHPHVLRVCQRVCGSHAESWWRDGPRGPRDGSVWVVSHRQSFIRKTYWTEVCLPQEITPLQCQRFQPEEPDHLDIRGIGFTVVSGLWICPGSSGVGGKMLQTESHLPASLSWPRVSLQQGNLTAWISVQGNRRGMALVQVFGIFSEDKIEKRLDDTEWR